MRVAPIAAPSTRTAQLYRINNRRKIISELLDPGAQRPAALEAPHMMQEHWRGRHQQPRGSGRRNHGGRRMGPSTLMQPCSLFVLMGRRGEWSRWGRGMCEGWSLEIGTAFRGAVVRQDRIDQPPTWLASVNAAYLGEYLPGVGDGSRRIEYREQHGDSPARLGALSGGEAESGRRCRNLSQLLLTLVSLWRGDAEHCE